MKIVCGSSFIVHQTIRLFGYLFIGVFVYLFIGVFSRPVHAETLQYLQNGDVATIKSLETLFKNLVQTVVGLSGVALFVMLLVGGFTFLFSGGDQKKLEQARGTITSAIIGLVIIVGGYLILRTIEVFTGVNVTTFTIPTQ